MSDAEVKEKLSRFTDGTWTGARRLQGVQGSAVPYILSLIAETSRRPMIIVAPSARDAETAYNDLRLFLTGENPLSPFGKRLHLFPSWEPLPFENLSPHPDDLAARLEGLYKLVEDPAPILVSSPAALM